MNKKIQMCWIGIIFLVVFIPINTFSQWICDLTLSPLNPTYNDEVEISISTGFPFGYGSTCPSVEGFELLNKNGNEPILELYYNISGAWPQVGCSTTDTFNTGKWNSGDYQLAVFTNTVFDSDTNYHQDSDTIFIHITNQLGIQNSFNNAIYIYPNPASSIAFIEKPDHIKFVKTELYDLTGNLIRRFSSDEHLNIKGISPGLYQLIFSSQQERFYQKLLIK